MSPNAKVRGEVLFASPGYATSMESMPTPDARKGVNSPLPLCFTARSPVGRTV